MAYPITETARLKGGVNDTYWVQMVGEDGTEMEGVWKPISGEYGGLRDNIRTGTFYLREAAAYEIAKAFKLDDLVPVTQIREYNGEIGSVQEFKGAATLSEGEIADGDNKERSILFDFLVFNTDRHQGNWMLEKGDDSEPVLIDNGLILPLTEEGFRTHMTRWGKRRPLPPSQIGSLKTAKVAKLCETLLDMGIEPEAVDTFYQRVQYAKEYGGPPREMYLRPWKGYETYSQVKSSKGKGVGA